LLIRSSRKLCFRKAPGGGFTACVFSYCHCSVLRIILDVYRQRMGRKWKGGTALLQPYHCPPFLCLPSLLRPLLTDTKINSHKCYSKIVAGICKEVEVSRKQFSGGGLFFKA